MPVEYIELLSGKISVTSLLIVAIASIARRNSLIGAVLASVPLVSVLAISDSIIDTKDINNLSVLASSALWLVRHHWYYFCVTAITEAWAELLSQPWHCSRYH